jgi:hypothetical protein
MGFGSSLIICPSLVWLKVEGYGWIVSVWIRGYQIGGKYQQELKRDESLKGLFVWNRQD